MHKLPFLSLAILLSCSSLVHAQAPAAKDAVPPAKGEPAAQPSPADVENYVTELKALVASRETSVTRIVNEITALDQSIQAAVEKVLGILTKAKDSRESRTKVMQIKQETLAALKRAAEAYAQKRSLIAEELRTTKNEYRREDLFDSRGQIDERIDKMVDGMMKLALSMETDEGHERYVEDASIVVGRGRRGIAVPTVKRNPEHDKNKRQAAKTDKVTGELGKALDVSLQRLEAQEREITAKLAKAGISEEEKTRLGAELARVQALREERREQQAMLDDGPGAGSQSELDHKEVMHTEELVESITAGGRRDFTRMMAAFNELRTERQALATLKAKLDHAGRWLESQPAK